MCALPAPAEVLLQSLRALQLSGRQKRQRVVVAFWGFGGTPACDDLIRSLCSALRTRQMFCSDVGPERFEGVACVCQRQLRMLHQLAREVGMGMEVLELLRWRQCLQCDAGSVLLACVARIENGTGTRGLHPVLWGRRFEDAFKLLRSRAAVLHVTGFEFDAHNMLMMYMAQQATEHNLQYHKTRCQQLKREHETACARARHADMLQRENSRMLCEVQRAFRAGTVSAEVLHMVMFGDLDARHKE